MASRNNRGWMRIPRSKRKSERMKQSTELRTRLADKSRQQFENAANCVASLTAQLLLDDVTEILEDDISDEQKTIDLKELVVRVRREIESTLKLVV